MNLLTFGHICKSLVELFSFFGHRFFLLRNNLMHKISEDPQMLASIYIFGIELMNKMQMLAYFFNFLLSYLSLSCSFVPAPYLNPELLNNLNTLYFIEYQ